MDLLLTGRAYTSVQGHTGTALCCGSDEGSVFSSAHCWHLWVSRESLSATHKEEPGNI